MGRLLEDMTRLSDEIQTLHDHFRAFRKELAESNKDLQMDVFEMRADLAAAQARAAESGREGRLGFMKNLRRTVGEQRREMRADLAGAHRAWAGPVTRSHA
jgi:regulator of replication initiation timing